MKIFLSHASPSKPLVRRLTDGLPPHVQRWLDQDELSAGERFARHITDGIERECDFLLAFIDTAALDSDWVHKEVAMGLRRQRDLQRAFVLPVLIGDVLDRMHEIGLPPDEWLYLDARDHSDAGLQASAAAIEAELFKHASELIEHLRGNDRRAMIDGFAAELTEYEQAAYQWLAAMANPVPVMATLPEAWVHVRDTLAAYNAVSERFIPRLPLHRDRLSAAFRDRRSLCRDIAEVMDEAEDRVYRGALFALNEVLTAVHQAIVARERSAPTLSEAELAAQEARKAELLQQARKALSRLSENAADLVGDLTSELD